VGTAANTYVVEVRPRERGYFKDIFKSSDVKTALAVAISSVYEDNNANARVYEEGKQGGYLGIFRKGAEK